MLLTREINSKNSQAVQMENRHNAVKWFRARRPRDKQLLLSLHERETAPIPIYTHRAGNSCPATGQGSRRQSAIPRAHRVGVRNVLIIQSTGVGFSTQTFRTEFGVGNPVFGKDHAKHLY